MNFALISLYIHFSIIRVSSSFPWLAVRTRILSFPHPQPSTNKQKSNKTRRAQTIETHWTTCNTRLNVELANKLAYIEGESESRRWKEEMKERGRGGQRLKAIEKLLFKCVCRQQKFAYVNRNSSKNRPGKQFIYCRSTCSQRRRVEEGCCLLKQKRYICQLIRGMYIHI